MTRFYNDPKYVGLTPIVTTVLLEGANLLQLYQMWSVRSSLGQSPWGWLQVNLALWLWWNFYRVVTPTAKWARRSVVVGIVLNAAVFLTVLWFQKAR